MIGYHVGKFLSGYRGAAHGNTASAEGQIRSWYRQPQPIVLDGIERPLGRSGFGGVDRSAQPAEKGRRVGFHKRLDSCPPQRK
jgi:hypothetical protein